MAFLLRVLINGVAIWLATLVLSGLDIVGADTTAQKIGIIALIALVFGVVNAVVKPIVKVLSIPLYILTLGLFTLVVNALMLLLTEWITEFTEWGLRIDGFWWAVAGAFVISIVSFALSLVIPESRRR
ncbi:phage holin family protein [Cellulomonas palmilytica]|uniref:phage holin family protein n=1 Tax=Cellulomonas palmilytica TaxID=2608402 RepID=UPI001F29434F|nr:phage holin family protein [Cellulomonas palmilytica]UJP40479.1 phage holin family protein [Cellulomonas palmilytica]